MDDEDIDVDVEIFAVLSITFFISAIVFCMSPRSCLTAATLLDLEDEDDEDVTRCDCVAMCVLAIWTLDDDVLLLHTAEEDTLEFLLLEVAFKSLFVILYRRFLGNLSPMIYFIRTSRKVFHFTLE